jgi:antitoxin HicB
MHLIYPVHLTPAEEGGYVVTFRDLPEAITEGDDKADALEQASDCLEVVLALYMRERRRIPEPSAPQRGEYLVGPGSLMAAKTALYIALAKSGMSQRDLARAIGTTPAGVQRLLDPRHMSRHDQFDAAMRALGRRVTLSVETAA